MATTDRLTHAPNQRGTIGIELRSGYYNGYQYGLGAAGRLRLGPAWLDLAGHQQGRRQNLVLRRRYLSVGRHRLHAHVRVAHPVRPELRVQGQLRQQSPGRQPVRPERNLVIAVRSAAPATGRPATVRPSRGAHPTESDCPAIGVLPDGVSLARVLRSTGEHTSCGRSLERSRFWASSTSPPTTVPGRSPGKRHQQPGLLGVAHQHSQQVALSLSRRAVARARVSGDARSYRCAPILCSEPAADTA